MSNLKIVIGSPYNVHRVSYLDESLQWRGADMLKQFTIGERIGKGGFAQVYLATHVPTQTKLAVKIFNYPYSLDADKNVSDNNPSSNHPTNQPLNAEPSPQPSVQAHNLSINQSPPPSTSQSSTGTSSKSGVPVNTSMRNTVEAENINSEIAILKECKHLNVVSYFGFLTYKSKLYVFMEYCDAGSLSDLISQLHSHPTTPPELQYHTNQIKESHISYVMRSTLLALRYLHGKSIIHRDIKSANILLKKSGQVCVTDFGIAAKLKRKPVSDGQKSPRPASEQSVSIERSPMASANGQFLSPHTSINMRMDYDNDSPANTALLYDDAPQIMGGTPLWMSPEAIRNDQSISQSADPMIKFKTDVWSLGITAIEIAAGKPPHSHLQTFLAVALAIENSPAPSLAAHAANYINPSPHFVDFVDRCCVKDPEQRACVEELLQHPFVNQPFLGPDSTFHMPSANNVDHPHQSSPSHSHSSLANFFHMGRSTPPHSPRSAGPSALDGKKKRPFLSFLRRDSKPFSLSPSLPQAPLSPMPIQSFQSHTPLSLPIRPKASLSSGSSSPSYRRSSTPPPIHTAADPAQASSAQLLPLDALPEPSQSFVYLLTHQGTSNNSSIIQPKRSASPSGSGRSSLNISPSLTNSINSPRGPSSPVHLGNRSLLDSGVPPRPSSSHRLSLDAIASDEHSASSAYPTARRRNSVGSAQSAAPQRSPLGLGMKSSRSSSNLRAELAENANSDDAVSQSPTALSVSIHKPTARRPSFKSYFSDDRKEGTIRYVDNFAQHEQTRARHNSSPPVNPLSVSATMTPHTASNAQAALQSPTMANAHARVMDELAKQKRSQNNLTVERVHHQYHGESDSCSCSSSSDEEDQEDAHSATLPVKKKPNAFMRYLKSKLLHEFHHSPSKTSKTSDKVGRSSISKASDSKPTENGTHKSSISDHQHSHRHHRSSAHSSSGKHHVHYARDHNGHRNERRHHNHPLVDAPALSHTKSAPALPPIPKLQSSRALLEGAERSLFAAFSSYTTAQEEANQQRLARIKSEKAQVKLAEKLEEERTDKLKSVMDRMTKASRSTHSSPLNHTTSKPPLPVHSQPSPLMSMSNRRALLQRTKRMPILNTTVEEGNEEEDEDMVDNTPTRSAAHSFVMSSNQSSRNRNGSIPEVHFEPDDDDTNNDDNKPSAFASFFGLKKPSLHLNLSSAETVENENEPTIDVFEGDQILEESRRPPGLALSGNLDDDDQSIQMNNHFNPSESYVISSHGTLNLAQFKINSQGFINNASASAPSSTSVSKVTSPHGVVLQLPGSHPFTQPAEEESEIPIDSINGVSVQDVELQVDSINVASSSPHHDSILSSPVHPSASPGIPITQQPVNQVNEDGSVAIMLSRDDLVEIGPCGKGQNGVVMKALHLPTLTRVALKKHAIFNQSTRHQLLHELTAYSKLQSPYLVSFFGAFHQNGSIIMATEFMDQGSVQSFVQKHGKLNELVTKDLTWQALNALAFLHANRSIHRDIKPDNFLINSKAELKLADFGLVRELESTHAMTDTFLGTLAYLSPERLMSNQYGAGSDVWALGLTVIFCLTGSLIVDSTDYWAMMASIKDHSISQAIDQTLDPNTFSAECIDFVRECLRSDPAERWSADRLLMHPWMTDRESTVGDKIWVAELDDLDFILNVLIDRHVMPSLLFDGPAHQPHLMIHTAMSPEEVANEARRSGPSPSLQSPSCDYSISPPSMHHAYTMPVSMSGTESRSNAIVVHPAGISEPSPEHGHNGSPLIVAQPSAQSVTHLSLSSSSPAPSPPSSVPSSPAHSAPGRSSRGSISQSVSDHPDGSLVVELHQLHIDVPNESNMSPIKTSTFSSISLPQSPHFIHNGQNNQLVSNGRQSPSPLRSPCSDVSQGSDENGTFSPSGVQSPIAILELDNERAALLAHEFGIPQSDVQERFAAVWQRKASLAVRAAQTLVEHDVVEPMSEP